MDYRNIRFARQQPRPRPNVSNSEEIRYIRAEVWITLVALIVTSVFSLWSAFETRKQYTLANDQFKFTKVQYSEARNQAEKANAEAIKKEKKLHEQYVKDTTRVGEQMRFQISSNNKQLKIYEQQLIAFKIQASIAKKQYDGQLRNAEIQRFETRPIFVLTSVKIDSSRNKPTVRLSFDMFNSGKRLAVVNDELLIAYNKPLLGFAHMKNVGLSNLSPNKENGIVVEIDVEKNIFKDVNTVYALYFQYDDPWYVQKQNFAIAFRYTIRSDGVLLMEKIYGDELLEFNNVMNLYKLRSANLKDMPNFN